MIHAKTCEKLPNLPKVTAKILLVPFFPGHAVYNNNNNNNNK